MKRFVLMVLGCLLLSAPVVLFAQSSIDPAGAPPPDLAVLLTSSAGVMVAAIMLTGALKTWAADVPGINKVPLPIVVVLLAMGLTYLANRVFMTLPGSLPMLMLQAVYNAAAASGVREWVTNGSTTLRDSSTARAIVLLALPVTLLSIGCASAPAARHAAVVANTAVYDALAAAQDGADGLLQAEVITPAQRRAFSAHLLPALKSGRALVQITQAWKPGAPAPAEFIALVKDVQALIADVSAALPLSAQSRMLPKLNQAAQQLLELFVQFSGGELPPSFDALAVSFSER